MINSLFKKIVASRYFESIIIAVILTNCILIGVETYFSNPLISFIQSFALFIFTIEVVLRYFSSNTNKEYFYEGWNIFDLSIVLISFIPESLFSDSSTISAIRVLRVFRVLRLLRVSDEIKLIISVLVKSCSALFYNAIFFSIFLYLYSIIGVTLFQLPEFDDNSLSSEKIEILELYNKNAPNAPVNSPDPYDSLHETMFTLFRVLTGEDWTDIRYNLVYASELELIDVSQTTITLYHVSWVILSAFLLLNLVVGAILNNYNIIMSEIRERKKKL
tara:strand:+ start:327 stop:1151 length:825 start_codon:yes stop_codon:yes gene_type:complete